MFSHGFALGKNSPAASRICKQLAQEGVGMLRSDNLGLGDSEGDWGDGSFSHKVAFAVWAGARRDPALGDAILGLAALLLPHDSGRVFRAPAGELIQRVVMARQILK